MACFKPLKGYRSRSPGKNGGFGIVFDPSKSNGQEMTVPCGQCIGCRLARSRDWAIRCTYEMESYDQESAFTTFTYSPENLPAYGSLVPEHFQQFMKKLRRRIEPKKVRYFQCGEYGDNFDRPHHHAILFGFMPDDLEHAGYSNHEPIFHSEFLTKVWGHGKTITGTASFESAAYIARYCTKKVNGPIAEEHYERVCPITGVIYNLVPEYATMSTSPGIGRETFDRFRSDVFPSDEIIHQGRILKPPRYYADLYRELEPDQWEQVRLRRKRFSQAHAHDQTDHRLAQREQVKIAQFDQLKRGYEK